MAKRPAVKKKSTRKQVVQKKATRRVARGAAQPPSAFRSERELIVITRTAAAVRATARGLESATAAPEVDALEAAIRAAGVSIRPLFGISEEKILANVRSMPSTEAISIDFASFYRAEVDEERMEEAAQILLEQDAVEGAYVAPGAEPAVWHESEAEAPAEPPVTTPDFTARQIYLDAAPAGIDARYAWTVPGGSGQNVRIIDIEGGWRFTHEDLRQNWGGVIAGTPSTDLGWRNHGTAVIGEFGGDRNSFGVTGICPDANTRAISIFGGIGAAGAITRAADALRAGDIILIELHRPGPRFDYAARNDQRGYIAMEWWPDVFAAIRYAVGRGVIVVEAAGNGAEDFDDALYDQRPVGFPATWRNPLNPANPSSEAVVVGAGAPPPGTHGRNHGVDRSRLGFSNYGARVDTQGWGREVTTTGYGDLQGGSNEDLWYTDTFSGTSSASPIVVGALGCVQGARRAAGQGLLTSPQAIALLRSTGSPQQDTPGRPRTQRIGNRPNLRQMIRQPPVGSVVPLFRYWNPRIGDHFYTTSWAELGSGRYGWRYEGVQCYVHPRRASGTVPLYRYWNPRIGDHFYTTNWTELGSGRYGWRYEGVQCYVHPRRASGTAPLYRYWNPRIGDHFYTTNWAELGSGRYGWRYEGVQCWVRTRVAGLGAPEIDSAADEEPPPETFDYSGGSGPEAYTVEQMPAPTADSGEELAPAGSFEAAVDDGGFAPMGSFDTAGEDFAPPGSFETEESGGGLAEGGFTSESFDVDDATEGVTVNVKVRKS